MTRDVLTALLEAGATLASLNLVFLGFISSSFQHSQSDKPGSGARRYRSLAVVALIAFVIGVACTAFCAIGLLVDPTPQWLYVVAAVTFFAQLAAQITVAAFSIYRLV